MQSKKSGMVFIILGAVLILSALLLLLHNQKEDETAMENAEAALKNLQSAISGDVSQAESDDSLSACASSDMTVVEINGYGYIGYLDIPAIDLRLPVLSEWDYERMKIAPCRQFGSTKTDNLVIAGHNYRSHFAGLSRLEEGESVSFTEMDGTKTDYIVSDITVLQPTEVDAVQNSGHDLVLYTCTYGGNTRIVVFCDYVEK